MEEKVVAVARPMRKDTAQLPKVSSCGFFQGLFSTRRVATTIICNDGHNGMTSNNDGEVAFMSCDDTKG